MRGSWANKARSAPAVRISIPTGAPPRRASRFAEVQAEGLDFARDYARNLLAYVASKPVPFDDLHALNGTMSAFAELQQAVPGLLRTERPLKLILDRRPFI
jgi:hypothetical protein